MYGASLSSSTGSIATLHITECQMISNTAATGNGGALYMDLQQHSINRNSSVSQCHFININGLVPGV